jgi:cobalt-zinc-cadmium efflux system outer membrane protein
MRGVTPTRTFALWMMLGLAAPAALSQEVAIGRTVESLLEFARDRNPEYAAMQAEADAAAERVTPAGALPDPKFRMELRDITRSGDQNPTLSPSRVGSTRTCCRRTFRGSASATSNAKWRNSKGRAPGARPGHLVGHRGEDQDELRAVVLRPSERAPDARNTRPDAAPRKDRAGTLQRRSRGPAGRHSCAGRADPAAQRTGDPETEQHHLHTRLNALLARPARHRWPNRKSCARCRRPPGSITPHWRNVSAPVTRCWRLKSANSKRQKKAGNSPTGTATPTSPSAPGRSSTRVRSRNGK